MLNENAKKWVAALRSGEYKQTRRFLRDNTGFCCLGVACDVYAKKWGHQWGGEEEQDEYFTFMHEEEVLPLQVTEWLGLADKQGSYFDGIYSTHLTNDNDDKGKTFAEIANIIESEPKGLFA